MHAVFSGMVSFCMYTRAGECSDVRADHHFHDTSPHFAHSPGDVAKCIFLAERRELVCMSATMLPEGQCKGQVGPLLMAWWWHVLIHSTWGWCWGLHMNAGGACMLEMSMVGALGSTEVSGMRVTRCGALVLLCIAATLLLSVLGKGASSCHFEGKGTVPLLKGNVCPSAAHCAMAMLPFVLQRQGCLGALPTWPSQGCGQPCNGARHACRHSLLCS